MSLTIVSLKDNPEIAALVRLVSKKHKAYLKKQNTVSLSDTFWDGGSRSDYFLIEVSTKKITPLIHASPPQFGGMKEPAIQKIEPGFVLIEAGFFCGKPATPIVYFPI